MSDIWFTSDTHFYHKHIKVFCPNTRGGGNIDEMTETIIYNWNSCVKRQDIVYHLGDFSFGTREQTLQVLRRLNGTINLIAGNHDNKNLLLSSGRFNAIKDYHVHSIDNHRVIMFHFPIYEWDQMHRGSFHLHGHMHGRDLNIPGRILDVGIDNRKDGDMLPFHWEEVKAILTDKPIRDH